MNPVRPSVNTKEQINMTKVEDIKAEIQEEENNEEDIRKQIQDIDEEMEKIEKDNLETEKLEKESLEEDGLSQPEATGSQEVREQVQEPGGEAVLPKSEMSRNLGDDDDGITDNSFEDESLPNDLHGLAKLKVLNLSGLDCLTGK